MHDNNPYNLKKFKGIISSMHLGFGLLVCCIFLSSYHVKASNEIIEIELEPVIAYDDLPVDCTVNGYLRFETDIVISESNKVYINIEDLFNNLGIKCIPGNEGNYLSGFVENENNTYSLDFNAKQILIGNKTIKSENGFIKELGAIYVETTILTEAFGLNILFNSRSLSMKMEVDFELPIIKQMRIEQMRQNVSNLQNESVLADTIIPRDYHLFKFGMIDWSLNSAQTTNEIINNHVRVGVGAEFLCGELNVSAYYDDQYQFDDKQLYYSWRFVDNDKKYIKQAQAGKIHTQTIAFINSSIVGATINNSPTTLRKTSGSYTISDYTEPNWMVELYINDVLVDYTEADASGLYVFEVPIVYGYTTLKLKFYGPLGEVRLEERTMNVPFTFLPAKTLEYSVTGGVLQYGENGQFGQGVLNYGLTRIITIGAGLEYLSSIPDYPYIPFATLALQPISKMVLNFEYAYGVRMTGLLNYSFGKSAFLEIDYAKYEKGQLATQFNADEERKARLSVPFKIKKVSGYGKVNFQQSIYGEFTFNRFDVVFTGYYKKFNANLTILNNWQSNTSVYSTANLSLSYTMRNGLVFRPSAEYNLNNNSFLRCRAEIEKRVAKMYFSVSYERNILFQSNNFFLTFSYDLPFARVGVSGAYNNKDFYFSENAQGSLALGGDNNYVKAGNTSSVGKGGILFFPFLDLNQNGSLDTGEQMVLLSNVQVSGGRAIISEKDSIVRISDLNDFVDYNVEFSNYDLENIAWRFKHLTYQVLVDPNQYKRVYVPILSLGEINGMVYLDEENTMKGLGRVTIQIWDKKGNKVAETLSERDGYFNYLGLNPGDYIVRVDEEQLENLDFQSTPPFENISINVSVDGDFVNGLDFVLRPKGTSSSNQNSEQERVNAKEVVNPEEHLQVADSVNRINVNQEIEHDSIGFNKFPEKNMEIDSSVVKPALQKTQPGDSAIQRESSKASETGSNEKPRSNINTSFVNIAEIEGTFYTVQIGVYKNYVTAGQLNNLTPIFYEVLPNGTNRYFSGKYNSPAEAEIAKKHIIETGIKGARVVTHQKGNKG